jgi:hypothetical protein
MGTLIGFGGACSDDGTAAASGGDTETGGSTSSATTTGETSMGSSTTQNSTTLSTTGTTDDSGTTGLTGTDGTGTTGVMGESVAVVVGYGARRASSVDGETWENFVEVNANGGDDNDLLRGVAYGGGDFVAVGGADDGLSFSSSDGGVTWENENRTVRDFISDAVYFGDEFIGVGGNGLRVRTADLGVSWDDDAGFEMAHFRGVAAGDDTVVAVGHTYAMAGFSSTTQDGVMWTAPQTGGGAFRDIAWGAGTFVAVGDAGRIARSVDGAMWTDETVAGGDLSTVLFVDGTFYVGDAGRYWVSDDGDMWTEMTSMTARPLVGWFGSAYFSTSVDALIERSTDLDGWTMVFTMPGGGFTSMAVGAVEM